MRSDFFAAGIKSQSKRYEACSDDVEHRNTIDANFQVCTQNQIEAQRSGFDLERRSKGAGGWCFFMHEHKKAPEQSGLCSDVEYRNTIDATAFAHSQASCRLYFYSIGDRSSL